MVNVILEMLDGSLWYDSSVVALKDYLFTSDLKF